MTTDGDGGRRRMSTGESRTMGEVTRALEALTGEVRTFIAKVEGSYVRKDVYDERERANEKRLAALESSREWLVRTVGVLVIAAVMGLIFAVKP